MVLFTDGDTGENPDDFIPEYKKQLKLLNRVCNIPISAITIEGCGSNFLSEVDWYFDFSIAILFRV